MPLIKANGIDLHYEVTGQGTPLLFIHGLGSCAEDWEYQVTEFARDHQVITFDFRGHGRSQGPKGPYAMKMLAGDAEALLRALGVGPAHVVGVSLGGGIAFQLAVSAPKLVKTLCIVNSGPEGVFRTFKQRLIVWKRFAMVWLLGLPKMGRAIAEVLFPGPEQTHARATFVERFSRNDRQAYIDTMHAFLGWSVLSEIGGIQCPTLFITAEFDYTPAAIREAYVAKMPNARLVVIPDSRHGLPMEKPAEFNAALRTFLTENA